MRAVCSGTDGIGCCGWSDMAKPPEITAPTPLSTFRLTHSPTVSGLKWDSLNACSQPARRGSGGDPDGADRRPPADGGHGGGCQVQPDEGRDLGWSSLSAASVPDRKARGHVVAYLNDGS